MEPGVTSVMLNHSDHTSVTAFCKEKGIGLVVVGPEAPLVDGKPFSECISPCRGCG